MEKLLKNRIVAYVGALICTLLWGTAFPFIKLGYITFNIPENDIGGKLLFAGERFFLAGIIVLVFGLIVYKKGMALNKSIILPIGLLGFVQTFLQYVFSYIGVGFTTATNTSIISGTTSFISVILAGVLFKSDRLTAPKIIGCITGFVGIVFINIQNLSQLSADSIILLGDLFVFLSAVSGAGGNVITKKLMKNINPTVATAYQLTFGGLCLLVLGLILGGKIDLLNLNGTVILLWLSIVSAVSFLLWTALLKYHPVSRITVFTLLIPIFGTMWSGIILGEDILKVEYLFALLFVSTGILLVNLNLKRKNNL